MTVAEREAPGLGGTRRGDEQTREALTAECSASGKLHAHRPAVGEIVEVNGLAGRFVVVSNSDPAIVILRNDRGVELRVGERQIIQRVRHDRP